MANSACMVVYEEGMANGLSVQSVFLITEHDTGKGGLDT